MSQDVCQTVFLWTDDMDTSNMKTLLKQYRIKTSLTMVTSNGTLYVFAKALGKITFDMNVFLVNNRNEMLSQHHYFSKEDANGSCCTCALRSFSLRFLVLPEIKREGRST